MSNGDKRKVSTDALETLGMIHTREEKRDAIHLAVMPAEAAETLEPGAHVRLVKGLAVSATSRTGIGIVDPFLTDYVRAGQRFWLVIYPRKINSLRHVWSHPDIPDELGAEAPVVPAKSKELSEKWLRDFCARSDCPGYEEVLGAAVQCEDEYLHFNGNDAHGEIPPEFWDHVEVVTGRKMEHRATYFSCSC